MAEHLNKADDSFTTEHPKQIFDPNVKVELYETVRSQKRGTIATNDPVEIMKYEEHVQKMRAVIDLNEQELFALNIGITKYAQAFYSKIVDEIQ